MITLRLVLYKTHVYLCVLSHLISAAGNLTYTLDLCKVNCSSSRDHHKCRLVIVVKHIPGCKPVFSLPFVVLCREKNPRRSVTSEQPTPIALQFQNSNTPLETPKLQALAATLEIPRNPSTPLQIMLRVHSSVLDLNSLNLLAQSFEPIVGHLSGFITYKYRALHSMEMLLFTFSHFETIQGAENSLQVLQRFINNEQGYENPYQCNLTEKRMLCLLSCCTSW